MLLSRYNCFHWNILEETYIKGAIYLPNICQQMAMKVYTINHHHTQQLTDELTGGACPPHWPHTGLPHSAPPKWAFNRVPLHFKYLTDWLFFLFWWITLYHTSISRAAYEPSFSISHSHTCANPFDSCGSSYPDFACTRATCTSHVQY